MKPLRTVVVPVISQRAACISTKFADSLATATSLACVAMSIAAFVGQGQNGTIRTIDPNRVLAASQSCTGQHMVHSMSEQSTFMHNTGKGILCREDQQHRQFYIRFDKSGLVQHSHALVAARINIGAIRAYDWIENNAAGYSDAQRNQVKTMLLSELPLDHRAFRIVALEKEKEIEDAKKEAAAKEKQIKDATSAAAGVKDVDSDGSTGTVATDNAVVVSNSSNAIGEATNIDADYDYDNEDSLLHAANSTLVEEAAEEPAVEPEVAAVRSLEPVVP